MPEQRLTACDELFQQWQTSREQVNYYMAALLRLSPDAPDALRRKQELNQRLFEARLRLKHADDQLRSCQDEMARNSYSSSNVAPAVRNVKNMLVGIDIDLLPDSIEEARPGTMLVHSIEHGAEYTEVLPYTWGTDTYFMEQRAADYLRDVKYTSVEFKDVGGKIHRYDRESLKKRGWFLA